jgi:hypothetical protein
VEGREGERKEGEMERMREGGRKRGGKKTGREEGREGGSEGEKKEVGEFAKEHLHFFPSSFLFSSFFNHMRSMTTLGKVYLHNL